QVSRAVKALPGTRKRCQSHGLVEGAGPQIGPTPPLDTSSVARAGEAGPIICPTPQSCVTERLPRGPLDRMPRSFLPARAYRTAGVFHPGRVDDLQVEQPTQFLLNGAPPSWMSAPAFCLAISQMPPQIPHRI